MYWKRWIAATILIVVGLSLGWNEFPKDQPYPWITYAHVQRQGPDLNLFIVTVDLTDKHVHLRVSPAGEDPDGKGPWQTTLLPVKTIAAREKFDVAINGDFFCGRETGDQHAKSQTMTVGMHPVFTEGQWARVSGNAMTDGKAWATRRSSTASLCVDEQGKVTIQSIKKIPEKVRQVVSGDVIIVKDGRNTAPAEEARHPHTAVGLDRDGKRLIILVVDGRRLGWSVGMNKVELADEMIRLGCQTALNLDGGGSSTLVMRNPESGEQQTINRPSDGKDRSVANVLGVQIDPAGQ